MEADDRSIKPEQIRPLSPEAAELFAFYDKNYEFYVDLQLPAGPGSEIRLGSLVPRSCRYCGATEKSQFKKVAHAVPEAVGNRTLISLDECDRCNEYFGRELDQHFANYLGLTRTLWQIKGKRGVPKYGVPGRSPRLWRAGENSFAATALVADDFVQLDADAKSGKINAYKQPYRPISVFKSMVKSALAVMPCDELVNFEETLRWVRSGDSTKTAARCFCFASTAQVTRAGLDVILLRRKSASDRLPYMSLYMSFANVDFQIFLPGALPDSHFAGEEIQVKRFPNRAERIGSVRYRVVDLSSSGLVRDEPDNINFEIHEPGILVEGLSAEEASHLLRSLKLLGGRNSDP
jgi:HNH endonuclease